MNAIFGFTLLICTAILVIINPDGVLTSFLAGGQNALDLTVKLTVIYAVWLGVFEIMERSNLSNKIAKLLRPLNRFLFGKLPEKATILCHLISPLIF